MSKYLFFCLIFFSCMSSALAQQVKVSSAIERDSIWLGDQIKMILVAEYPVGTTISFPQLPDSLGNGVEVISRSAKDSSKLGDGILQMRQSYLITAFDSGPHPIKPFKFVGRTKISHDTIRSNSLVLFVKVPPVDLKKGFADIKKPYGGTGDL